MAAACADRCDDHRDHLFPRCDLADAHGTREGSRFLARHFFGGSFFSGVETFFKLSKKSPRFGIGISCPFDVF